MTLRKVWNMLTRKNSGKSKMKNYDMAEAVVDLIELIAEQKAASSEGKSSILELIILRAALQADMILQDRKNKANAKD